MSAKLHPTQTPEYWLTLARSERVIAAQERGSRFGSVESMRVRLANAEEYEKTAASITAQKGDPK